MHRPGPGEATPAPIRESIPTRKEGRVERAGAKWYPLNGLFSITGSREVHEPLCSVSVSLSLSLSLTVSLSLSSPPPSLPRPTHALSLLLLFLFSLSVPCPYSPICLLLLYYRLSTPAHSPVDSCVGASSSERQDVLDGRSHF